MNGELILINHPAQVSLPMFPDADAAGIAFSADLIAVAFLGHGLQHVQLFANKSATAFERCPYYQNWKKHVVLFDDGFNFGRVLLDVGKKVKRVGYDPTELKITEASGAKFMPVNREDYAAHTLAWMEKNQYLNELLVHADTDPDSVAAMVTYYWNGLRSVDGAKCLTRPADRIEPILAIINALAAEEIGCEESLKLFDIARLEAEEAERIATAAWEAARTEKRESRRVLMEQYAAEHGGQVRVRNLRNGFVSTLPFANAWSLVEEMHGAEFAPFVGNVPTNHP